MELTQRIRKFADDHSDGIEDADAVEDTLKHLLNWIILHCRNEWSEECYSVNTCDAVVSVIPTVEKNLCVCIKAAGKEWRESFEYGISENEIKENFLKLLNKDGEDGK